MSHKINGEREKKKANDKERKSDREGERESEGKERIQQVLGETGQGGKKGEEGKIREKKRK